jgi:hypothetical protein
MLLGAAWIGDPVILVISIDQVLQDGATFEDSDFFAVFVNVGDGRDTPVGIDLEIPILLLLELGKVESDKL